MKIRKGIALLCAAALCMSALTAPSAVYATTDNTTGDGVVDSQTAAGIVNKEQEVEQTKNNIENTQKSKTNLQNAKIELEGYLGELNAKLQQLGTDISTLETQITGKEAEIASTQTTLEAAKADESKQYENMKKRIRFMYEEGNSSLYAALMTGDSISDIISRSEYIAKISKYDRDMLQKYQDTKQKIADNESALHSQQDALTGMQGDMKSKQAELEKTVASIQEEIKKHEAEIAAAELQISGYEQALAQQEAELGNLQAIAAAEAVANNSQEVAFAAQQAQAIANELTNRMNELGLNTVTASYGEAYAYTQSDLVLLATLIYVEAGAEPYEGQCAVGACVMNRIRSAEFPNSIIGVIYDPGQFTPVTTGRFALALAQSEATESCYQAAQQALNGYNNIGSYLYFRTPNGRVSGLQIGGHIFHDGSTGF